MRLMQVMAGAPHGGAENFFLRLALALKDAGVDQHLVVRPAPVRDRAIAAAGLPCTPCRFGGPIDFLSRRRLSRAVAAFRPHVLLSWMNRATEAVRAVRRGGEYLHVGTPRGYYDPKYYQGCDRLVVTTPDLHAFYCQRGWPPERVRAIPNFVPDIAATPVARASVDTPEEATLLLGLGRLHANKGFDVLLAALSQLPACWLWLAGSGPQEGELKRQAAAAGVADRVRFLGWREDVPALLAAADIFVCSSRHEPFGNIVPEAWASRTPVVAAASQGPRALIDHGRTGLLVPVDDPHALAAAIGAVRTDPALAHALADAGRATFERHYSAPVVVRQYLDFLESLTPAERDA